MAEVHIQEAQTLESALQRFKRKVQQEDIIAEFKRHSVAVKRGEKQRAKGPASSPDKN
jgi:small subunit ribosomal protein S21